MEQRLSGFAGRRLTRTHHAVDVEPALQLVALDLVGHQRVADVGTGVDVVDIKQAQRLVTSFLDRFEQLFVDFRTGFRVNFTGRGIDQFVGDEHAVQVFIGNQQVLEPLLCELAGKTRGDLGARLDDDLLGFRHR
jgi:hypothetical protein